MNKLIIPLIVLILLAASSGCIFPEEEEKVEEYVLKAVISVDKPVVFPNDVITFNASLSEGDIVKYYWDFNVSGALKWIKGKEIETKSYPEPGIYTVALKVVDKNGDDDVVRSGVEDTPYICVNYCAEHQGAINKRAKNDTYFPVKTQVKRAIITLTYDPKEVLGNQIENLDLSVKAKCGENYTYVKSANDTKDDGLVKLELSKYDIFYADWYAEVYYNITIDHPLARETLSYDLKIEVRYNP